MCSSKIEIGEYDPTSAIQLWYSPHGTVVRRPKQSLKMLVKKTNVPKSEFAAVCDNTLPVVAPTSDTSDDDRDDIMDHNNSDLSDYYSEDDLALSMNHLHNEEMRAYALMKKDLVVKDPDCACDDIE